MLRPYCLSLLIGATLFAPLACNDNGSGSTTDEASTTAATTTTGGVTLPTTSSTSTGETPTTTVEVTTTEATTTTTTTTEATTATSTGGPPPAVCTPISEEFLCKNTDECKWGGIVSYAFGNQGCQGSILPFCVDKAPSGGATAWYREVDNDVEVVEFGYTPELPPEWKPCDCDGPLACLCSSVTEACPERQEDYCGFITTELGCDNLTFMGKNTCDWFKVWPEGPNDNTCTQNLSKNRCLPATDVAKKTCTKTALPPFGACNPMSTYDPTFWREANGIVEIITSCGPVPVGFTLCEAVDTPEQPDECTCNCQ